MEIPFSFLFTPGGKIIIKEETCFKEKILNNFFAYKAKQRSQGSGWIFLEHPNFCFGIYGNLCNGHGKGCGQPLGHTRCKS